MSPAEAEGGGDARMRRLRREPGGRRHAVKVLLSDAEYEHVEARAGRLRVSVPRFFVESALAEDGGALISERNALMAEFVGARTVIARAGAKLDQVAAQLNATGQVDPPQVAAVLEAFARGLARVETAAEELRAR